MDVVREDDIGIGGLDFTRKGDHIDIFPIQVVEVRKLISLLKPK